MVKSVLLNITASIKNSISNLIILKPMDAGTG
jgi:hypothetical protein